jgi:WD40 repeat protein
MVRVWDLTTGQAQLTLEGHAGPVSTVAINRDGQRIVSGSWDGTIKVWDAQGSLGEDKKKADPPVLSVGSPGRTPR